MPFEPEEEPRRDSPYLWFALRVRSNREQVVAVHLRGRGIEEFSPSYKVVSAWSDRKRTLEKFLFPGYVFCRIDPSNRLPVLSIPGVMGIVGNGKAPEPIPECEIDRVRTMVCSGLPVTPWPYLAAGDFVLIERGPLAGVEGILQEIKGQHRIVVSFRLLQRSVSSEIDRDWVRPIRQSVPRDERQREAGRRAPSGVQGDLL
jgi:transcription termination/antitermination protein NusG